MAPIDFIGSICSGDAKVRTFKPLIASSVGRRLLEQHHGRAVIDRADHPQAAVEEHGLQMIAIGRIMDHGVHVLGRNEQAGHIENLESRIEVGDEGRSA